MTEDELRAEKAEAQRLQQRINSLIHQINQEEHQRVQLEKELTHVTNSVVTLTRSARGMDDEVHDIISTLSERVDKVSVDASDLFKALADLSDRYFVYKNLSTASKNITQLTDEYHTRFAFYAELRRITLGYVVGLDGHIISSESLRQKVEKAYLQNTEYWLAYCISAVMLWASEEREASQRAMNKGLQMNYNNACLFFLLINLRFGRTDAARKWYVNYLDRVDAKNLGEEWQYLLQAYLCGTFGADASFQQMVHQCFVDIIAKIDLTTADYAGQFVKQAADHAADWPHQTDVEYTVLRRTSPQWDRLKELLSSAEKNRLLERYYTDLTQETEPEAENRAQRIENVLYSLVNSYDVEEKKVLDALRYNEAIVAARGNLEAARQSEVAARQREAQPKTLSQLMMSWSFSDEKSGVDISVKRFSISMMKKWIMAGFARFAENYRSKEPAKVVMNVDGWQQECGENDYELVRPSLEAHYAKRRLPDTLKDRFVLLFLAMCVASVLTLVITIFAFTPVALVIGILLGIAGGFLLWRRIVEVGRMLQEKKRKSLLQLYNALGELRAWREGYAKADAEHAALLEALEHY